MAKPVGLLRGSLITLRRKCGTSTCRCVTGDLHETPALSYSAGGKTKMLTLQEDDVAEVKAALARYNKAKAALMTKADRNIAQLTRRIEAERARARRKR